MSRSFLHVQSFIYIHSFIHSSIVHDVYVCVYMHSHVSYGVDMEIEGQLKGVVSLLQPFEAVWWKVPLTSEPFYQPPCATVCTEKVKGTDSCRVPYD